MLTLAIADTLLVVCHYSKKEGLQLRVITELYLSDTSLNVGRV